MLFELREKPVFTAGSLNLSDLLEDFWLLARRAKLASRRFTMLMWVYCRFADSLRRQGHASSGFNEPFADTCVDRNLMTCKVIRDATARTALVATLGTHLEGSDRCADGFSLGHVPLACRIIGGLLASARALSCSRAYPSQTQSGRVCLCRTERSANAPRHPWTCDRSNIKHSPGFQAVAEVFSFQMLLDSATKHERARCIRVMQEEGLMKEEPPG